MTPLTPTHAISLWRKAKAEEIGIRCDCVIEDLDKIKHVMYAARKAAPDAESLSNIMLCIGPGGKEFFLVKRPEEAP